MMKICFYLIASLALTFMYKPVEATNTNAPALWLEIANKHGISIPNKNTIQALEAKKINLQKLLKETKTVLQKSFQNLLDGSVRSNDINPNIGPLTIYALTFADEKVDTQDYTPITAVLVSDKIDENDRAKLVQKILEHRIDLMKRSQGNKTLLLPIDKELIGLYAFKEAAQPTMRNLELLSMLKKKLKDTPQVPLTREEKLFLEVFDTPGLREEISKYLPYQSTYPQSEKN